MSLPEMPEKGGRLVHLWRHVAAIIRYLRRFESITVSPASAGSVRVSESNIVIELTGKAKERPMETIEVEICVGGQTVTRRFYVEPL
jgi:hypothetical protein